MPKNTQVTTMTTIRRTLNSLSDIEELKALANTFSSLSSSLSDYQLDLTASDFSKLGTDGLKYLAETINMLNQQKSLTRVALPNLSDKQLESFKIIQATSILQKLIDNKAPADAEKDIIQLKEYLTEALAASKSIESLRAQVQKFTTLYNELPKNTDVHIKETISDHIHEIKTKNAKIITDKYGSGSAPKNPPSNQNPQIREEKKVADMKRLSLGDTIQQQNPMKQGPEEVKYNEMARLQREYRPMIVEKLPQQKRSGKLDGKLGNKPRIIPEKIHVRNTLANDTTNGGKKQQTYTDPNQLIPTQRPPRR